MKEITTFMPIFMTPFVHVPFRTACVIARWKRHAQEDHAVGCLERLGRKPFRLKLCVQWVCNFFLLLQERQRKLHIEKDLAISVFISMNEPDRKSVV